MHVNRSMALLLGAWLALAPAMVGAQAQGEEDIPNTRVQLKEMPRVFESGKAAAYRGEADEKGVAFTIPSLNINTVAALVLESGDPAVAMTLHLKNDMSDGWDRSVETGSGGALQTTFRTEGPAVALVRSNSPGAHPYRLVVWVGPEIKPHKIAAAPFVSQAEYARGAGGGWLGKLARLAGWALLLVVLAAAAVFIWMRARRTQA